MIRSLFNCLVDLVYPPHCFNCKRHLPPTPAKGLLCPGCRDLIEYNRPPFCLKCSRHLHQPVSSPLCPACRETKASFDFAWCACLFNPTLRDILHQFKYHQKTLLRSLFIDLMVSYIHKYNFDIRQFDILTPIPLSSARHRARGYNQSELLARGLSEKFGIPICTGNLIKTEHTKAHAFLGRKERWTNIQGAFRIKYSETFKGQSVLIIDDLLTTGATVCEASSVLKKSGAKTVGVLTLAVTT